VSEICRVNHNTDAARLIKKQNNKVSHKRDITVSIAKAIQQDGGSQALWMPAGSNEANEVSARMRKSDGLVWRTPAEFCWCGSFAGTTFTSKTASAKFKMCQQNFKPASKIINPNDFDKALYP
jgi:hypothetical protein